MVKSFKNSTDIFIFGNVFSCAFLIFLDYLIEKSKYLLNKIQLDYSKCFAHKEQLLRTQDNCKLLKLRKRCSFLPVTKKIYQILLLLISIKTDF